MPDLQGEGSHTLVVAVRNVQVLRRKIVFAFRHRLGGIRNLLFHSRDFAVDRGSNGWVLPSGEAQLRCRASNLSTSATSGSIKLSDVASQIQYFVVALPRGIEVRSQAASQTMDAYIR